MLTDRYVFSFVWCRQITGIFAKMYEVYKRMSRRNGRNNAAAAAAGGVGGNIDNPEAAVGAAGDDDATGRFNALLRISPDVGLLKDLKYFVVGLFLSLVPSWRPMPAGVGPAPGAADAAAVAAPDAMPAAMDM